MRNLFNMPNVDKSNLADYPDGRVKDNDGTDNGTPVSEQTKGDIHQLFQKLMRLYDITPNNLPDNETNGYQLVEAFKALASKNDYIYPLNTNGTELVVDIKFAQMLENEYILCLAGVNKGVETSIKGSQPATFPITYSGDFKANEYVRVIKTTLGVSIIRVADFNSLNAMVSELGYLKKATTPETIAGAIDDKAVTPLSFLGAFTNLVIGANSVNFLASTLRNGLYPKTHFDIVAGIGATPLKMFGTFTGSNFDDDLINGTYATSGDISSAHKSGNTDEGGIVRVVFGQNLPAQYMVTLSVRSHAGTENANDIRPLIWYPVTANAIEIYIENDGAYADRIIEIYVKIEEEI